MSELIAFIGVGNMGNPMAQNLVQAGKKVKVFDVSKDMINKAIEKTMRASINKLTGITKSRTAKLRVRLCPKVKPVITTISFFNLGFNRRSPKRKARWSYPVEICFIPKKI